MHHAASTKKCNIVFVSVHELILSAFAFAVRHHIQTQHKKKRHDANMWTNEDIQQSSVCALHLLAPFHGNRENQCVFVLHMTTPLHMTANIWKKKIFKNHGHKKQWNDDPPPIHGLVPSAGCPSQLGPQKQRRNSMIFVISMVAVSFVKAARQN